jgi:ribose-phosphate pyrophosphokinase
VIPYFGYGRQDRKDQPRVAIGAKLVANLVDGRGGPGSGDGLPPAPDPGVLRRSRGSPLRCAGPDAYFRKRSSKDLVVVAPDVGSAKMARGFAKRLEATFAIIDKRRPARTRARSSRWSVTWRGGTA